MDTELSELDNPIWAALGGRQGVFGGKSGDTRWFIESVAPFVAVPSSYVVPDLDAAFMGGMGSSAFFIGECPRLLPQGWRYVSTFQALQLLPPATPVVEEALDGRELSASDREQLVELAQIAFPMFFRPRTAELGTYIGVFEGKRLIAMAGERMSAGSFREISGVCTHPDHVGRGHARALTQSLLKRHVQQGLRSFLHVSEGNSGARKLYKAMGFTERASLTMGKVEHIAAR